jgi:hypothetical protein
LFWCQTGESHVFGPEVLKDVEKQVQMVRESLMVAQSRQKSYADKRRRDLSFETRVRNIDALFLVLGWDWFGFNKKRIGRRYAKLAFLHLVGAVAHVVHSVVCGAKHQAHVDRDGFHKMRHTLH